MLCHEITQVVGRRKKSVDPFYSCRKSVGIANHFIREDYVPEIFYSFLTSRASFFHYPTDLQNHIIQGDAELKLKELEDNSVDCLVTDPPYGYSFMGKDWDKAVPKVEIWQECLRVLKPGGFAFIMSSPRQDVLSHMIVNLDKAGFNTGFTSLYWAYASGFPKASNIGKLVDKRNERDQDTYKPFAEYLKHKRLGVGLSMSQIDKMLKTNTAYSWWEGRLSGIQLPSKKYYLKLKEILNLDNRFDDLIEREEAEREIISRQPMTIGIGGNSKRMGGEKIIDKPATTQAKKLDGSYAGYQPKPAVEIILVCMKPLQEKTYVDQAMKNGKGVTWLDDVRVPINPEVDDMLREVNRKKRETETWEEGSGFKNEKNNLTGVNPQGRFPANLVVSDDVLNDGRVSKSIRTKRGGQVPSQSGVYSWNTETKGDFIKDDAYDCGYNDSGSFSRYFDLDKWAQKTYPFLIVPKASKCEKNMGCEELEEKENPVTNQSWRCKKCNKFQLSGDGDICKCNIPEWIKPISKNHHPCVKPLKLMQYLITLGSRPNDIILDPFIGSGTTAIASRQLNRNFIGIELNQEYIEIANERLRPYLEQIKLIEVDSNG